MNEFESKIVENVKKAYGTDTEVTMDTVLTDLDRASMKLIALLAYLETEFDVEVPLREAMNMKTVGELADYVSNEM